jgi:galactokinase/mevalonate kinase-like predicted kinase
MKENVGYQDQIFAVFGGFNLKKKKKNNFNHNQFSSFAFFL